MTLMKYPFVTRYLFTGSVLLKEVLCINNGANLCEKLNFNYFYMKFWLAAVRGKTTGEWHKDDIQVHTSDILVTCEYIGVTYRWHRSTYKWHRDDIPAHMSDTQMTYEYYDWHTDNIRMTYELHTSTYEWHTNDIRMTCHIILN